MVLYFGSILKVMILVKIGFSSEKNENQYTYNNDKIKNCHKTNLNKTNKKLKKSLQDKNCVKSMYKKISTQKKRMLKML